MADSFKYFKYLINIARDNPGLSTSQIVIASRISMLPVFCCSLKHLINITNKTKNSIYADLKRLVDLNVVYKITVPTNKVNFKRDAYVSVYDSDGRRKSLAEIAEQLEMAQRELSNFYHGKVVDKWLLEQLSQ